MAKIEVGWVRKQFGTVVMKGATLAVGLEPTMVGKRGKKFFFLLDQRLP